MTPPIPLQQDFWNDWNARHREFDIPKEAVGLGSALMALAMKPE